MAVSDRPAAVNCSCEYIAARPSAAQSSGCRSLCRQSGCSNSAPARLPPRKVKAAVEAAGIDCSGRFPGVRARRNEWCAFHERSTCNSAIRSVSPIVHGCPPHASLPPVCEFAGNVDRWDAYCRRIFVQLRVNWNRVSLTTFGVTMLVSVIIRFCASPVGVVGEIGRRNCVVPVVNPGGSL